MSTCEAFRGILMSWVLKAAYAVAPAFERKHLDRALTPYLVDAVKRAQARRDARQREMREQDP